LGALTTARAREFWNLDQLKTTYLRFSKIVVKRVTVVKFRTIDVAMVYTGSFVVKVRSNAAEFAEMDIARFRDG